MALAQSRQFFTNEYKLDNPPADCIQSVKFGLTDNDHLLTASWDCSVRLYDVTSNSLKGKYHHEAPVLDVAFQGCDIGWSAGADNRIKRYDFQSQTESTVGWHTEPVRCLDYIPEKNLFASGSWDRQIKLWDPRLIDSSRSEPVGVHQLSGKVYAMAPCGDKLIAGTSKKQLVIWDLRNMSPTLRDSALKYQIRTIGAMADKRGFVVGSIEGRASVEYLDPDPAIQKQKYSFKCHRIKDANYGMEIIYPVNAISFHQRYNTFATGGSDGYVSVWDGRSKKRLSQFHRLPSSVLSLGFSPDGSKLAIACSLLRVNDSADNDSQQLLNDSSQDCIYIRRVSDQEVRGKI